MLVWRQTHRGEPYGGVRVRWSDPGPTTARVLEVGRDARPRRQRAGHPCGAQRAPRLGVAPVSARRRLALRALVTGGLALAAGAPLAALPVAAEAVLLMLGAALLASALSLDGLWSR